MEAAAASLLTSYSPSSLSTKLHYYLSLTFPISHSSRKRLLLLSPPTSRFFSHHHRVQISFARSAVSIQASSSSVIEEEEIEEKASSEETTAPPSLSSSSSSSKDMFPKVDKTGRFCSPRAARELALSMVYASCLEGSDPVRLFDKRVNAKKESEYEFDKNSLLKYNHMTFGGPPVTTKTVEEADEFLRIDEMESAIEAEVLSAPPKLVYSKLILRFTRKLLVAIVEKWDDHVLVIDKVAPENWKNEPAGRILELCILHLAMSEIGVLGTRHQIVINEAVDLAKRFCDGAAPRIINGCLRTYVKEHQETNGARVATESNRRLL